jgi:hypothetical protein
MKAIIFREPPPEATVRSSVHYTGSRFSVNTTVRLPGRGFTFICATVAMEDRRAAGTRFGTRNKEPPRSVGTAHTI